jgi:hypothetical protein
VASPTDAVDAAYELISFPPGETPRWEDFQQLFVKEAVLALRVFPSDPSVSVLSLEQYAESQMRHNLQEDGYTETPGKRVVDVVGDVATVRQAFTMNFAGRSPIEAVDTFSLVRTPSGWKIVAVISDLAPAAIAGETS